MAKVIIRSDEHYEHLTHGTEKIIQGNKLIVWSRSKKSDLEAETDKDKKARLEIRSKNFSTGTQLRDFVFSNYTRVVN